jgi:hypothetical protein
MEDHGEVILRQRVCRAQACHAVFWLCLHCDRGQRYCSLACRDDSRLRQRRRANLRHQGSPEGRLDHRDRQRAYRHRQTQSRVTDQGSISITSPASSGCEPVDALTATVSARSDRVLRHARPETRPGVWQCCRICGRPGRFVDTSPRIFRRR